MERVNYPYGAIPEDLSISISPSGTTSSGNLDIYHFPDDKITELLTQYGHNRCLGGFDASKQDQQTE